MCVILAPLGMAAEKEPPSSFDRRFLKSAAAALEEETQFAELGMTKAVKAEVKAYAKMVVADHARSSEKLAKLAASKAAQTPTVRRSSSSSRFKKLAETQGTDFDNKFLTIMVSEHGEGVRDFEEAFNIARDEDVRAFAGEMRLVMNDHLRTASKLNPILNTAIGTSAPDNTARNARDRTARSLTPLDQGSSKNDTLITAQIRKAIIATKKMSVNARNVKIITVSGKVTLRGPVNTAEEKRAITEIAGRIASADLVDCQLEVK